MSLSKKTLTQHHGIYRGIVKDNKDPKSLRRLKLVVQTTGTEVTDWAWPVEPSNFNLEVPTVGQGVWVMYIGGDPEYPVWVGTFGTNQGKNKNIYVKPLDNSVSLTGLSSYLETKVLKDGTTTVNLTNTIMLMANKLAEYETRIASLETQLSTLHTTLASRTTAGHTHTSNG
jgi:hypothetical protein